MASGTVEAPSQEPVQPVQSPEPQTPPQKTVAELMFERFDIIEKRLDLYGNVLAKMAENQMQAPQAQAGQPPRSPGLMGVFESLIPDIKDALKSGGGGGNDMILELYKKAHENFDTKVLLPTFTNMAREGARHVASGTG